MIKCIVPGCDDGQHVRKICMYHYGRFVAMPKLSENKLTDDVLQLLSMAKRSRYRIKNTIPVVKKVNKNKIQRRNNPDSNWKWEQETYEEYCERHKEHGTTPLDKIKWLRIIVEGDNIMEDLV
jgi:hypothetical protein